jgi:PAS domain S-box-containing protein
MQQRPIKQTRRFLSSPWTIAVLFATIALAWLPISDNLISLVVADALQIENFSILKNIIFILVAAVLLFLLVRKYTRIISRSEARYHILMEEAADGIVVADGDGNNLEVNGAACTMLGYSQSELLNLNWRDIVDIAEQAAKPIRFSELRNNQTLFTRRTLRRRDGTVFPAEVSGTMLLDGRLLAIVRDVTEAKQREDLILRRNRQLQIVSTAIQRINTVLDIPVILRSLVDSAMELTGAESGMGGVSANSEMVFSEYHLNKDIMSVDYRFGPGHGSPGIVLKTKKPYITNNSEQEAYLMYGSSGTRKYYNLANVPILSRSGELLGCFEIHNTSGHRPLDEYDSTLLQGLAAGAAVAIENARMLAEQKRLENQLRHSQKLEAIGVLAGGIAHDFNNILTAVIGYGNMILVKAASHDPLRTYAAQILTASERAASLVRGLLAFSRKQIINPYPVDINSIIRNVGSLLSRVIGEDVELVVELENRDLTVMADPGQMEQVLMNLSTNARDAMNGGGFLTIRTEKTIVNSADEKQARPGEYACITVTDTGMGMDRKTKERIFEPFFTTKEVGKGTGLGLAMVYGIISQHNGWIAVSSQQGKGATFAVYLPLLNVPAGDRAAVSALPLQGGSETVLLAEDNVDVRMLAITVLEEAGYTVFGAADGEEAVQIFEDNRDSIDLLVLDVIMPRKNGKESYEYIKGIKPEIKTLFMSGYTSDVLQSRAVFEEGLKFIQKPISPAQLLQRVREVLDAPKPEQQVSGT